VSGSALSGDATATEVEPSRTRRGGETRATLLDSTIQLLASTGYAATTTQAVLNHSGLSRGSLLHQFRTREALMVAAAEEAVERMFAGVETKLSTIDEPAQALRQYPYALWEVQNEPPARAYAELQLASRWELGLQAQLRQTVKSVNERMSREVRETAERFGLGDAGKLMVEIGALISAMQGLAVSSTLVEDEARVEAVLSALTRHYNDCLDELIAW
jgi:AcrR family transcriptional regulator